MFLRSGRIDDVVSIFHLLLQDRRRNNEPVVIAKTSRLYQYRSFINDDAMGFAPGERLGKLLGSRADGWVNDGVEFLEELRVAEDQRAKAAAVNLAFLVEDFGAELVDDRLIGFGAFGHYLVAECVGFDQEAAHLGEGSADESFPAGEAAGPGGAHAG